MNLKIKGKKGVEHAGMVILYVIITFVFLFFLSAFIDGLVSISLYTYNQENYILFNRALLSPNSFFEVDAYTSLVNHGVIDIKKFNDDTLKKLYYKEDSDSFGLKATLRYGDQEKIIYLHKEVLQLGLAIGGIEGSRYAFISHKYPVSIIDGNKKQFGVLILESVLKQDDRKFI